MKSILPNSRKHDISFHPSGRIDISATIAHKLSLNPGDVIDIAEDRGELYLYVKLRAGTYTGRHDGTVRYACNSPGTFRTWSTTITHAVLHTAGINTTLRCPCGTLMETNNTKYITIIYHFNKQ